MSEQSLLTLGDWQRAYLDGASPRALLGAPRPIGWREASAATWIHHIEVAELEQRIRRNYREPGWPTWTAEVDADLLRAAPLFGIPFAVKDNIDVAAMPTTAACPAFAYRAETSAHAVQRLVDAGAVCLGKTNLDQFATGLVGARSPYGRPASAFAAGRVSGGSSSGSALAVARGDVAFALGTDTAGSGRVPASFNNVVGLKPTGGRVGTSGVVPACRTLDCVSIFALTVEDAAARAGRRRRARCTGRLQSLRARSREPAAQPAHRHPARFPRSTVPGYAQAWPLALQAARDPGPRDRGHRLHAAARRRRPAL